MGMNASIGPAWAAKTPPSQPRWKMSCRERPEADQQDQDRGSQADNRGESERRPLGLLDGLAAELDLQRR
jgi:hypothetical protein